MEGIQTFKGSWPWPWPWIRPYGIPSCITHRPIDLYLYTKFHWNLRNFLWTDGRTYGCTDGHFPPSNIIRSTFGSRPKKYLCEVHISPYCRQAPVPPNFMKFGVRGPVIDVITCVKFLVNRFRGYRVPRFWHQKTAISHWLAVSPLRQCMHCRTCDIVINLIHFEILDFLFVTVILE